MESLSKGLDAYSRVYEDAMGRINGQVIDFTDLPSPQKRALLTESPECPFAAPASKETIKSMSEHEKEHILSALISCNWKLYGQDGAANLLQMHPSTLNSRMKKLGIHKKSLSKLHPGKK